MTSSTKPEVHSVLHCRQIMTEPRHIKADTHYPYILPVHTRPVHTARMYRPYVRVSKMHPYIRAVNAARIYGCSVLTTRIDGLYSRKELLFYTGRIYIRVSKMHPYVRAIHKARIYTGRIYGWCVSALSRTENFVKFGHVVFEIRADRQTYRDANCNISHASRGSK